jgi:Protein CHLORORESPIRATORY REDUCTION 7
MSDPRLYNLEHFVVLEADQPEQFLTTAELHQKLKLILTDQPVNLPSDIQRLGSIDEQAQYLLETYCDLDLGPGQFLQWYAVRLDK